MASEAKTIEVNGETYEYTTEKPYQDAGLLQTLYWEKGMSQNEISDFIGCSQETVSRWMNKLNIEARKPSHERPAPFRQSQGYEVWRHQVSGTHYNVSVHRLLAVAEYGFDAVCGDDVHHQNDIPWDNRPDNIEIKLHEQHRRDHMEERYGDAPWREADSLRELYVEKQMTQEGIADKWGCSQYTISTWLDKHDIEKRSMSEGTKLWHADDDQQTLTEAD